MHPPKTKGQQVTLEVLAGVSCLCLWSN